MGGNSRVVFGALLLVGFCCFLLLGVSTITRVAIPPTARAGVSNSKGGSTGRHEGLVLNYVSKRRVPNGPDPIHNRSLRLSCGSGRRTSARLGPYSHGKSGTPHNHLIEPKIGLNDLCTWKYVRQPT